MKNSICNPDFNRDDGECHSSNFMTLVTWLEFKRQIVIQKNNDPNFLVAAFDTIDWNPLKEFQHYVLKLICEVCDVSQKNFSISAAFKDVNKNTKIPSVAIMAKDSSIITSDMLDKLDKALIFFCQLVLKGHQVDGQGHFFPIDLPEETAEIVASVADDFLTTEGGKKIGEPRLLKTARNEILICGTYLQKNDRPLPAPERRLVTGEIDGLRGATRHLFVITDNSKTLTIIFDEAIFKIPLRNCILDGHRYELEIESAYVDYNKKFDTLISFRPIDSDDLKLL